MHKHLQNQLNKDPRRKDCIEFKNPNVWMHSSVERHELKEFGNGLTGFALLIATVALMFCLLWAASEYPSAFKVNSVTVNK